MRNTGEPTPVDPAIINAIVVLRERGENEAAASLSRRTLTIRNEFVSLLDILETLYKESETPANLYQLNTTRERAREFLALHGRL